MLKIQTGSWMYNAGIVGIINILEYNNIEYTTGINYIEAPKKVFTNFGEYYFKYFISKYSSNLSYNYIDKNLENILENIDTIELEEINTFVEKTKTYIKSASYNKAFIIAAVEKEFIEIAKKLVKVKKDKSNLDTLIETLKELNNLIKEPYTKQQILNKNVMYNILSNFFGAVSIFNRDNVTKDAIEVFNSYYGGNILDFYNAIDTNLAKKKPKEANIFCNSCFTGILQKKSANSLSWLNSTGVDLNYKSSHYWNLVNTTFICPVCTLVYMCIPAGITYYPMAKNGLFVNNNVSVSRLVSSNLLQGLNIGEATQDMYYKITDFITTESNNLDKVINNNINIVEIDFNNSRPYKFNLLDKQVLEVLDFNRNRLKTLVNKKVKVTSSYYLDIYQETLKYVLNKSVNYNLLDRLIKLDYSNGVILEIILKINTKGWNDMELTDKYLGYGKSLKTELYKAGKSNRIQAIHYKLHSALSTNNLNMFLQTITQVYINNGIKMHTDFRDILKSDDFKLYGYAFLLGLGYYTKNTDNIEGANENAK